eukprot:TRINITY_DN10329_c0_g1_i1.p1 TRINITY_DN10329_c0_g1~~TRINITY_DN10329_c0_g1_i1.p1  ORF type:complete len:100 (-),score=4.98 TRINITY_DN10329_c0_g1_i1:55-354(-)
MNRDRGYYQYENYQNEKVSVKDAHTGLVGLGGLTSPLQHQLDIGNIFNLQIPPKTNSFLIPLSTRIFSWFAIYEQGGPPPLFPPPPPPPPNFAPLGQLF